MDLFLLELKETVFQSNQFSATKVHVVIGNEACDLDSAVSAITYAYFLHTKNREENAVIIPVLNIPESQFRLRTETTHFFQTLNIVPSCLLFKDHVDFDRWHAERRLKLTLVDHNVLTGTDVQYEDCVVEVIDHHVRERPVDDRVKIKLDFVGSCCTLVAEELLDDPDFEIDESVAELLCGTILVDTINRSREAGKVTPRDEAVLSQLQGIIPNVKGDSLFKELQAAKFNISGLLNMEILEKDLKMVNGTAMTIAMCSVTMDMKKLLERGNFKTDLDEFCIQHSCEVVVIMTLVTSEDDKPEREIAVYSVNRIFRDQIADTLDNSEDIDLELEPLEQPFDDITVFSQGNVQASRKKVMPILKSFLHGDITPDVSSKDFVTQHSVPVATEAFSHLDVGDSDKVTGNNESRVKFTLESLERNSTDEEIVPVEKIEGSYRNFDSVELESPSCVSASHTVHVQQIPHDFDLSVSTGITDVTQTTLQNMKKQFGDIPSSAENNSGLLSSAHSSNIFDLGISDSELVDPFSSVEESANPDISVTSPKEEQMNKTSENETELLEIGESGDANCPASEHSEINVSDENKNMSYRNPDFTTFQENVEENKTEISAQDGNPFVVEDTNGSSQIVNFQINEFDDEASVTDDLLNGNYSTDDQFASVDYLNVNSLRLDHPPAKKSASLIVECDAKSQADDLAELEESELFDKITTPEAGHSGENSPFIMSGVNSPFINSGAGTPYESSSVSHSRTMSDSGFPDTVVPPNSLMDHGFHESDIDRRLPSFNNAEMVERIQQKKAALGVGLDLLDLEDTAGESSTTYTPQNSFRDEGGMFMHDSSLPNLMDSEFVEKVQQKRDSLSAKLQSSEESADINPASANPFGDFTDLINTSSVPSTNPFFQTSKESIEFDPFGPLNTSSGKSGEIMLDDKQEIDFIADSTVFKQREEIQSNVDILDIFGESDSKKSEYLLGNPSGSQDWPDLTNTDVQQSESTSTQNRNPFLTDIDNSVQPEQNIVCESVDQNLAETKADNVEMMDKFTMEAINDSANLEAADAVSEILAREIIHDAIESFPDITNPLVATEMIQGNNVDWTEQGSGDSGISSTGSPQQGLKVREGSRRLNQDYSVETEYLPNMDPLHGSLNITSTPTDLCSIETDADKEVVEAESFRKVSGEGQALFPTDLYEHDKMEHIAEQDETTPDKIKDMIISQNIQSASFLDEPEIEKDIDVDTETTKEDTGKVDFEIFRTEKESLPVRLMHIEKSADSDTKDNFVEDIDAMKLVDFAGFDDILETGNTIVATAGYSEELSSVIENVKDGILKENIQASALDMNLNNSNNNFVCGIDYQHPEHISKSDQLDSEGNVFINSSVEDIIENTTKQESYKIESEKPLINFIDFENITGKNEINEGKTLESDFSEVFGKLDVKEVNIVSDICQKSESKSLKSGDTGAMKDESENMKSSEQVLESYLENDKGTNAMNFDTTEITCDSECDESYAQSFQDSTKEGIDNEGFDFDSLSNVNIGKESEIMLEEEVSTKTYVEPDMKVSENYKEESVIVFEKTHAEVEKSESDNSVSSDASSSFPTTSESESELVTVRENLKSLIDDNDIFGEESTSDLHGNDASIVADVATNVLNLIPDEENLQLGRKEILVLTDVEMEKKETETIDREDSEHDRTENIDSAYFEAVDKVSKAEINVDDMENDQNLGVKETLRENIQTEVDDSLILINQPMTASSLTVETISPVETPLDEHASGFFEVNSEIKGDDIVEVLNTNSTSETNLSEIETGFYDVNKDQDDMMQSAVTIDSVSSVDTSENDVVTGLYELNAELLEQAIENDDRNFLNIKEDYSDASVSPLETPENEDMKGFYNINAEKLEKAIERIDSLDVDNTLMLERTFSDSSVSPVETPDKEAVSGFYEMNDSYIVESSHHIKDKANEISSLGPEDVPEINIELVESPNSSKDSFDSETEPGFELNDNKSMEEERKVNEGTITANSDNITRDNEEKDHAHTKAMQSGEFDIAPEINVEMTSSTDSLDSHESVEDGFYEMNAEIQGTMLQNIAVGNAFSPVESPSEEVFNLDYEINPMVPDVKDDSSTQSFEENSPESYRKPFVRFVENEKEVDGKVDEMADALVETALSEAIDSLQEQYLIDNSSRKRKEKLEEMIVIDKPEENIKYIKIADEIVNQAIASAIEMIQEIRLNEEEPFITSEIASAMKESSDSSDSEASSTTTEGSYRIINSVDLSPEATPDREKVTSLNSENEQDQMFEESNWVTEDLDEMVDEVHTDREMSIIEGEEEFSNEVTVTVLPDVVHDESMFLNDENGNITVGRRGPDSNQALETNDIVQSEVNVHGISYFESSDHEDDKGNDKKRFERQETLVPDIIISTEETPPGSDESESKLNKELVKADQMSDTVDKDTVKICVTEKEEADDKMPNVELELEFTVSKEMKESETYKKEIVTNEETVCNDHIEKEACQDRDDKFETEGENLIKAYDTKTERDRESTFSTLTDVEVGNETNILYDDHKLKQQSQVVKSDITGDEIVVSEIEADLRSTAERSKPDIDSFDEIIKSNEQLKCLQSCAHDTETVSKSINAEQINETEAEENVNINGPKKKEEVPYHNIKDLESEKDERKGIKAKKGEAEYVTRKEIFYTSAGRMSISIDSIIDPPSDSDQGYTVAQDIIHEEPQELIQVSHILARTGSAIFHADEVLTQLSDATIAQQHDNARNSQASFVDIVSDSDDDTLSNHSQIKIMEVYKENYKNFQRSLDLNSEILNTLNKTRDKLTQTKNKAIWRLSFEPVDDDDDSTSEKHVVIEKIEPEKPKHSHEKMKMDDTQEWHEDPIPGMGATTQDSSTDESDTESDSEYTKPPRPDSLLNGARRKKKIAANNFLSPDSTDDLVEGIDDIPTPDDLETPSDIEGELEWEDDTPITPTSDCKKFVEYRDDEAEREKYENTKFRKVEIAGKDYRVDMKVIEPYKKVLSHGGYYGDGLNAIILFCGCYLPDRGRRDYQYVMDNLFLYVISTLELLVAEDYMIVYFHGATPRRQMPSFGWLKRCYQMIDRRLRKNLKALLMVHPTLWLKTVVMMTKPFISSKFSSKLRFVKTLQELAKIVPMEYIYVPEPVSHSPKHTVLRVRCQTYTTQTLHFCSRNPFLSLMTFLNVTERMLQSDPEYLEKWEKEQEKKGLVQTSKSKFSFFKRKK